MSEMSGMTGMSEMSEIGVMSGITGIGEIGGSRFGGTRWYQVAPGGTRKGCFQFLSFLSFL